MYIFLSDFRELVNYSNNIELDLLSQIKAQNNTKRVCIFKYSRIKIFRKCEKPSKECTLHFFHGVPHHCWQALYVSKLSLKRPNRKHSHNKMNLFKFLKLNFNPMQLAWTYDIAINLQSIKLKMGGSRYFLFIISIWIKES